MLVDYDLDDGKGDQLVCWARKHGVHAHVIAVSAHKRGNQNLLAAGADVCCAKTDFKKLPQLLQQSSGDNPEFSAVKWLGYEYCRTQEGKDDRMAAIELDNGI